MRLLLLDIETAPNVAHVWGLWQQNIGLNQLLASGYVMCWAAKWYGEEEVFFESIHRPGGGRRLKSPRAMLRTVHKLLDECDAVITYNGKSFDIPTLQKEFLIHGMAPPAPFKHIDLCQVAKSAFRFPSNKLAHIAKELDGAEKKSNRGHELWVGCMNNDQECWKEMEEYNRGDVVALEDVYNRMRPWVRVHPNAGVYDEANRPVCPACGSSNLQRRGTAVTSMKKYRRYQCKDCGTWMRGDDVVFHQKGIMRRAA
jgi:predicted RNA-binding Zn-ribbon protein involved in translation (DUF1610 family)